MNADLFCVNLANDPGCICGCTFKDAIHFILECCLLQRRKGRIEVKTSLIIRIFLYIMYMLNYKLIKLFFYYLQLTNMSWCVWRTRAKMDNRVRRESWWLSKFWMILCQNWEFIQEFLVALKMTCMVIFFFNHLFKSIFEVFVHVYSIVSLSWHTTPFVTQLWSFKTGGLYRQVSLLLF